MLSSDFVIYAVDNRCPHMGFPLHRGTVKDCLLTCDWHYARFNVMSGGTFESWADDLPAFPVQIRHDEVWINLAIHADPLISQKAMAEDDHGLNRPCPTSRAIALKLELVTSQ
ncbi:Rieske (2Fe-2S) protein [Leptodesmis sp.]|uniref:Rieske (2Fe-2S) protein n=1 Tax=Leptodesmis sp. TaxID=3100501 RepID=UPI0040535286